MPGFNKEKDDEFDIEAAVSSLGEELFGASAEGDSDADTSDGGSADNSSVPSPDATDDGAGAAPVVADKTAEKEPVDDAPQSPPPDSVAPPKTWRPEAAGMWAQLPPAVQQEVLKRESDIFQGWACDASWTRVSRPTRPRTNLSSSWMLICPCTCTAS